MGLAGVAPHYRPDVDGLRAIAVLAVLFYHVGGWLPGGYIGVDVFFVISGYLITTLIVREQEARTFTLASFYGRRIRRIVPASMCLVIATLAIGPLVLFPESLEDLAESAVAQQLCISNFYFWSKGGYFDGPREFKPLLHTWSLAVEEQFYLLFPLLLVITRRWRLGARLLLLVGLTLASLLASDLQSQVQQSAAYYLLPSRAWEMLTGALLAFTPAIQVNSRQRAVVAACGLLSILVASCLYDSGTAFPGLAAILPCAGAAAFIYAGPESAANRVLASKPLVGIGLASYSLYLWHWPLLVFARCLVGKNLSVIACIATMLITVPAAFLSWRFVELPFRRKGFLTVRKHAVFAMTAMVSFLALVVVSTNIATAKIGQQKRAEFHRMLQTGKPTEPVVIIGDGDSKKPVRFLLWGDSHACAISELCETLACERGIRGACAARLGFVPLVGVTNERGGEAEQLDWNKSVVDFALKDRVTDVIICARWELRVAGAIRDSAGEPEDVVENARRVFADGLKRTVATFSRAGIKVWFLRQVPIQLDEPPGRMANIYLVHGAAGVSREEYSEQQSHVERLLLAAGTGMVLIGPGKNWFDDRGRSRVTDGRDSFYLDDDHLSTRGADELIRPLLEPVFDEIKSR
jgi:peptidoglycan/LPS O-acetylase OafA/YrhL